jgi:phage shock protein PspC (stress-responsive transcriptional regulator)
MTSLDDLLTYDEPEPERPTRSGSDALWWWLLKSSGIAAVVAGVAYGIARLAGYSVPYLLLFMVVLCVIVLYGLVNWIRPRPLPATLVRASAELVSEDQETSRGQDGLYLATARWDTRLAWVRLQNDKGQFARTVQPMLIGIIDERLRQRHGVLRPADPRRARALMGEQLWAFVTVPLTKNPTPREVAGVIALMEEL